MSKHNYSQYSNKNNKPNNNTQKTKVETVTKPEDKMERTPVVEQIETQVVRPSLVNETVETVTLPNMVYGVVARCAKLNVRENPIADSAIVCVLDAKSEVKIDVNKSTENWYYVCSANGAEGYCMKPYIDAHM